MSIFTAFGLSASAGLNAYIPLLVIALLARYTHWITLDPKWQALTHPAIIALLVVLAGIEFFADKVPAVNHLNDAIQTIVRPVAGAIAFAAGSGAIGEAHPVLALAAGLLVAGSVHATKSLAVRPAVSLTTGGVANTPVSLAEDAVALGVSLTAILVPVALLIAAAVLLFWAWRRWRHSTHP